MITILMKLSHISIYIYGKYGRLVVLEIVQVHLYFSICRSEFISVEGEQ
ncbi:MAG: hypothetical protein LM560_02070 [Desulfurococcaceae archaeon]|nr:hypothetical protein [Desulfurococcaceae archaeon]